MSNVSKNEAIKCGVPSIKKMGGKKDQAEKVAKKKAALSRKLRGKNGGIENNGARSKTGSVTSLGSQTLSQEQEELDASILICKYCHGSFNAENDQLIECERCEDWVCFNCSKLSQTQYEVLTDDDDTQLHWYCVECLAPAITAVKTDNSIEEKCKQYFENFKADVVELVDSKVQPVRDELDAFKSEQTKTNQEVQDQVNKCTRAAASCAVKEIQDREERKYNVILYQVPESEESEPLARKDQDTKYLETLCKDALQVKVEFTNVIRLGKISDHVKIRPVRAIMNSVPQVTSILQAAKKLADQENASYRNISINKDMTPLEREEIRELLEIRNNRQRESNRIGVADKWVVRKGRVVNVARRPAGGPSQELLDQETQERE